MKKLIFIILMIGAIAFYIQRADLAKNTLLSSISTKPKFTGAVKTQEKSTETNNEASEEKIEVIADNLDTPWAMDFLPDGEIIFTQRKGTVTILDKNRNVKYEEFLPGVKEIGEGGLMGIAVHPNFKENGFIYTYDTISSTGEDTINTVTRYILGEYGLTFDRVIIQNIPGAQNHNGGRIKFGPDGMLYAGTGDAQKPSQAQNINSLAGKILRVTDEGEIPSDNPFGNEVYSYGHRNVQGLAWDKNNNLWATEHGRSGVLSGLDELNLIVAGKNYGWPEIQGNEVRDGMEKAILNSGNTTWAPAGLAIIENTFYFGGLRGQSLYTGNLSDAKDLTIKSLFSGEFGRIREVISSKDGSLYITTSNKDGRGNPQEADDKIIRIPSTLLKEGNYLIIGS